MTIADSRVVERNDGVAGVDRMWDSQWVNVVNKAKSIEEAAKLTEQYMAANHKSLLAEAERENQTILVNAVAWMDLANEREKTIAALQSRLDAVGRLADEMQAFFNSQNIHVPTWHRLRGMPNELRSAALGGESPGNEEETK